MSNEMINLRERLVVRLGASYGRARFMWLCQKYNVMPWDDVPEGMRIEICGR